MGVGEESQIASCTHTGYFYYTDRLEALKKKKTALIVDFGMNGVIVSARKLYAGNLYCSRYTINSGSR